MTDQRPTEANDAAPSALAHLIGQRGVVDQVAVALEAAAADSRKFDHALLVGGPGLGKSQVAKVVAAEMGTDLHEVLGQSVTGNADLNALLLGAKDRDLIHIDECHELDKEYQTALYLALDQRKVVLPSRAKGGPQSIPLNDFSLLLSTTDEYGLLQPLRDRMRLVLRFQFYTVAELAALVEQRGRALGWPVHDGLLTRDEFDEFVRRCGLTAEDVQTMGSIGAPGVGFGWAPAISFTGDDPDAILNAYVTPLPETRKKALGDSEWERVRDAVLAVYA